MIYLLYYRLHALISSVGGVIHYQLLIMSDMTKINFVRKNLV